MSKQAWRKEMTPVVRTLQIVVTAMPIGALTFMVVAMVMQPPRGQAQAGASMMTYMALAFAANFVIVRMAASTIRLELRCRPGHNLRITTMAVRAKQWLGVVTRVRSRHMIEKQGCPEVGLMTGVTFLIGHEMGRVLARCRDPIMTT